MPTSEEQNAAAGVGARNGAYSSAGQKARTDDNARTSERQSANRYVRTRDAQQAVTGREVEIVQALGIPWRAGQRDHIQCPYPEHGGADDWRLNSNGRAICTCTGGKTDSVFDIAAKVEGLDFEQSKIRCVEIIGRTDLIRTKGSSDSGHQRSDAKSLLGTPADRRDDTLPAAYFGHRLGLNPAAVLMPSTPVIGIAALPYFDPPKGKGTGKPVHVGDFPCVVLGQVDAEGQVHAHRIFVERGGAGKAKLGRRDDGQERDPKKSAKRPEDGASTAGRVVVWGEPKTAAWCIIAEGAETAAAIAHAFREQVGTGVVCVVAGLNAGGIEAFVPWPAAKRVTVAADRDEAPKPSRPEPTRRGERAARTFGIRNRDRVEVAIALPGAPGTATDWLDAHCADGTEAVRAGILAAEAYTPTAAEIAEERERREGVAELQRIQRDYPLPEMDSFTLVYKRTPRGQIKVHQFVKQGDEIVEQSISSPVGVEARLKFSNQTDTYGLRIVVQDMGGRRRVIDVTRADFAKQSGADTRAMLFASGLRPENDGEHTIVKCLKAADPEREIVVVTRPGWHESTDGGDLFFVAPSGQIIGAPDGEPPELSVNARISPAVARGGTLEGWKEAVAAACMAPRCEHWIIGAIAGFAAPLLALTGLDTCGINLSGMTSGGKTTAQRLAVSAWSRAVLNKRDSLLQSARATANGIEALAARANGTVLALDELGHVSGKELARNIYSLAGGIGKNRLDAAAQLRASHTWSTFVLLSSEKSLEERVRGDGGEWAGGMAVRIPDIDISGVNRAVDQAALDKIKTVDRHFGHAGPAFVEALVAKGYHRQSEELTAYINQTARLIAGGSTDGPYVRAALPLAILATAGSLAQECGLIPQTVDVMRAVRWAWARFSDSTDALALNPKQQAVTNIQGWIAARWGSEILSTAPDDNGRYPPRTAAGWYNDKAVYLSADKITQAAGGALKEIEIARSLNEQQLIVDRKGERHLTVNYVPKVGYVKAYALCRSTFGRSHTDAPPLRVHTGGLA